MSLLTRCVGLFLLFGLTLPVVLVAQEKEKDKDDKKPAATKDDKKDAKDDEKPEKKKDAKDDEKPEKKKSEPEEKLVYGQILTTKIKKVEANSNREFSVEIFVIDPVKLYEFNVWNNQQLMQIARSTTPQSLMQARVSYQRALVTKQGSVYSPKELDLRGSENFKVRSLYPPIEYDDRGFLKKWSKKELAALKGESKLPGYPSTLENLRPGQSVQVYLAKTSKQIPTKGALPKKKVDDEDMTFERQEAVMVVITQEVAAGGN